MSKRIFVTAFLLIVLALILPQAYAINWRYNLDDAIRVAKGQNKPIMADFYTEWCGWCKKLDSETYSDSKVSAAAGKFICVKINAEKQPDVANKYGVSGYPTVIFLDSSGNSLLKIPGYLPPDKFLANMNRVLSMTQKVPAQEGQGAGKGGGGFVALEDRAAGNKGKTAVKTVGEEFVYNGYMQSGDEAPTVQINYKGNTYFVEQGDNFAQFKVIYAGKEKVVLSADTGEITLEYKKPYKGNGLLKEITKTIAQPDAENSINDVIIAGESLPSPQAVKSRAVILSVFFAVLLVFYIYNSICLQLIAGKTGTAGGWMAWVPILNFFLMLNIGQIRYRIVLVPFLTLLVLIFVSAFAAAFNPLAGLIFSAIMFLNAVYIVFLSGYVWYKISIARKKSTALAVVLAVLMFVSPVNLISLGYLAFSK